jgi:hypothetical protein
MNDRRTLRVSKMKLVDKGETVASNKENIYILDVTYYFLDKQKSNTKSDVSAHEGDKE